MAKQRINPDEAVPQSVEDTFQEPQIDNQEKQAESIDSEKSVADGTAQFHDKTPEQKSPQTPAYEKGQEKQVASQADSYTLDILKRFPDYESLYIDSRGGIFTTDTPPNMRDGAVLYKNPYYKK